MAGATARWLVLLLVAVSAAVAAAGKHERWRMSGRLGGRVVEKERRRVVAEAEAGTVTAVDVADAAGTVYRLHFITMDPGALFLPVQLHADMVFYVHSGRGKVTYVEEDSGESSSLEVERGDVYNLEQGSIMFIQSYPNATRQRLRIYAIFSSEGINADDPSKPMVEAYSSVSNLLKGFETEVLRLGFGVHRDVAEAIKSAKTPPPIIPYNPQEKGGDDDKSNWTEDIVDALLGVREPEEFLNKKKKDKHKKEAKDKKSKSKAFNFYSGKPDVHNCYGWSRTMTNKDLDALHGSNIGMFMVNLTTGSMVGPHWNPKATEIAIVTDGSGIVQVVCPSITSSNSSGENRRGHHRGDEEGEVVAKCRNTVFRVKEGDVFVVPRFHPMAQMSFNNDSFVFVGFSTHMGQNHPQFLAGKGSVLQAIGKEVLALSLGQKNSTAVGKLLSAQRDSTILSCISCAEELEEKAAEEEQRRREQEEKERKEREEKEKREREEEERKREQEEKERKEREEEERKREQEEKERKEREEEERKKEQEEKERKEREEEERKREQEERERKEEEERQRRKEEERERREQEEKQRRKEEERARREEEQRQREEEERQREEEEQRREEEEGGGGRGDEPEREEDEAGGDEPPPYRLSKKLKKRYRLGTFRSG